MTAARAGAQTERRGGAGPARGLLGGKTAPAALFVVKNQEAVPTLPRFQLLPFDSRVSLQQVLRFPAKESQRQPPVPRGSVRVRGFVRRWLVDVFHRLFKLLRCFLLVAEPMLGHGLEQPGVGARPSGCFGLLERGFRLGQPFGGVLEPAGAMERGPQSVEPVAVFVHAVQ